LCVDIGSRGLQQNAFRIRFEREVSRFIH
jgi:hypothetical protein